MSKEIWKDIKGFENKYQISNLGRVKSLKDRWRNNVEVIKKPSISNKGYLRINLLMNNKVKNFQIHRLVAEAFIPNPNNYPCVNHKDENPLNNSLDNLEWCTYKYNANYGTATERRLKKVDFKSIAKKIDYKESTNKGLTKRRAQGNIKQVYQYDMNLNLIKLWSSAGEAKKELGFSASAIGDCCKGKYKKYKCFIWSYVPIEKNDKNISKYNCKRVVHNSRKVKCVSTGEVFNSMNEAAIKYNTQISGISDCAKGKASHAGKYKGENLKWEFVNK